MKLRPYIECKDFDEIKNWIQDERTHAMWSAKLMNYPVEKENFRLILQKMAADFGDCPIVAEDDDGKLNGFFCFSVNTSTNEGMFRFIMVNPNLRGHGIGQEMLKLAANTAFEVSKVNAVGLNVFSSNIPAQKCYSKAGFVPRRTDKEAFGYKDELWDRINMIIEK